MPTINTFEELDRRRNKERRDTLLSTPDAAAKLDISPPRFLKLAREVRLQPEAWYENPYRRSGPECPLWPPEAVAALASAPELERLKARSFAARKAREQAAKRRQAELAKRYPDWEQALEPAAEAMFNLNRYAKWASCAPAHRQEIYALKNHFVKLLYDLGYCVEVRRHSVQGEGRACWGCDGAGCERCNDTGYYREPYELEYIAFRFQLKTEAFGWHQPADLVEWVVESPNASSESWEPESEKPIKLPPRKFADAKALVRYVLGRAGKGQGSPPTDLAEASEAGQ